MENGKSALRNQLKQVLESIPAEMRTSAGHLAASAVLALSEFQQARNVMLFVSLPAELDTRPIITAAWLAGKRVAVPRTHMDDRSMDAVVIRSFDDDMQRTKIGVMEPIGDECLSLAELDFVLVPGLGFGEAGQRIGRGAGFYDRFLANAKLRAVTCGYGFERQVISGIPMSPHDTPIQMLVTDHRTRRFIAHSRNITADDADLRG